MGAKEINMTLGAQFRRQRTICGQEWVQKRSKWPLVLNSGDNPLPVGKNGRKEINMALGAQFSR